MEPALKHFILFLATVHAVLAWEWGGDIVFEDNFDGNALDLNKWEYQEGCSAVYGPNNLQCYTRNTSNVAVENGHLVLTARRENLEDKEYTSGRVRQRGDGFAYGAYVIRARLSRGDHLWPALWLLYEEDCRYEEIDIAEYRGQASHANTLEMTGHYGRRYDILTSKDKVIQLPFDLSEDFHEYAVLWLPSKLEWYVDKVAYFNVSLTDETFTSDPNKLPCDGKPPIPAFTQRTNFILNLAVGGSFFTGFPPLDPNTWTKPSMEIDWIRVYQE